MSFLAVARTLLALKQMSLSLEELRSTMLRSRVPLCVLCCYHDPRQSAKNVRLDFEMLNI
jgi:hypothetical protein